MQLKKIWSMKLWAWAIFSTLALVIGCGVTDKHIPSDIPSSPTGPEPVKKINFITLVVDDMGWSDCSFLGGEIHTPHIDQLADNGVTFTQFYGAATSSPSRSMLFTGKDCHQVGAGTMCGYILPQTKGKPGYECYLARYAPVFAELLQQEGYHTLYTGKWHLGMEADQTPDARGFSVARGVALEGAEQFFANEDGSNIPAFPPGAYKRHNRKSFWNENGKEVTQLPTDFYATDYITDKAIEMLKERPKEKPFYLNLAYTAVHFPLQAPDSVTQKYMKLYEKGWDQIRKERFERQKAMGYFPENAILPPRPDVPAWHTLSPQEKQIQIKKMAVYAAMLDIMDQNIGRLIDYLKEIGEYEDTLIFFTSDNGGCAGDPAVDKGYYMVEWIKNNFDNSLASIGTRRSYTGLGRGWGMAVNTPFNKAKATMYEGGVHVAAFAHYPKAGFSNSRYECVSSIMDIAPTILELAGVKYPSTYEGNPLSPMQGVSLARIFKEDPAKSACSDDRYIGWEFVGVKGLRNGPFKLSQEAGDPDFHLFNLIDDPYESKDLSTRNPGKLSEMKKVYETYRDKNGVVEIPNTILEEH
jgi:arylsulfatase